MQKKKGRGGKKVESGGKRQSLAKLPHQSVVNESQCMKQYVAQGFFQKVK